MIWLPVKEEYKSMKTVVLTFILLLIPALSAKSQNDTFAWHTYALVGPVRNVRTETAAIVEKNGRYVEGPRILSMTIAFNEDINRTEVCFHDSIGVLTRRIVDKYDGKRPTEHFNYDGKGNMWLRIVHDYDDKGQHTGNSTYVGDGSLQSRSVIKRNNYGQVVEESTSDSKGTLLEKFITSYQDEGSLSSIERLYYFSNGSVRRRELFTAKTHRTETLDYNPDGTLGRTSVRVDQNIAEYNKDGAFTKSIQIGDVGRLLDESTYATDGSATRTADIPDDLDSHGNWVKKTTWISDARRRRPVKVTYRVITYY